MSLDIVLVIFGEQINGIRDAIDNSGEDRAMRTDISGGTRK